MNFTTLDSNCSFLLQTQNQLLSERFAVLNSSYSWIWMDIENIPTNVDKNDIYRYIPFGTVEFVRAYCFHMNISFPRSYTYGSKQMREGGLFKRSIREGWLDMADSTDFVKPCRDTKAFTGAIKSEAMKEIDQLSQEQKYHVLKDPVYICEQVEFTTEYRFYIEIIKNRPEILGFCRYDQKDCDDNLIIQRSPEMVDLVLKTSQQVLDHIGLRSFSVDVGFRPNINEFDIVEINDAISLGLYRNSDSPFVPSNQKYADMIAKRWDQILFDNNV